MEDEFYDHRQILQFYRRHNGHGTLPHLRGEQHGLAAIIRFIEIQTRLLGRIFGELECSLLLRAGISLLLDQTSLGFAKS